MIYIVTLSATSAMQVYFSHQVQVGLLLADKTSVEILFKYSNYIDISLFDLIIELL